MEVLSGRSIMHLDLDSFFVSVERLKNSSLIGRPIIIGGVGARGVVSSCSYETRRYGVRSAMPTKVARRLCPEAIVISGDMDCYSYYSSLITDIIRDRAPLFEKTSIDEFYLDLSGMDRFHGTVKWAAELKQYIVRHSGLPITYALSVNKLTSKMGTGEAKPNGQLHIPCGTERGFIAPLPVQRIPMVGEKTHQILSSMGIKTVKTLREVPIPLLEREFGKHGRTLWEKANAIDHTPVTPYTEQKSMSKETTFEHDTIDMAQIQRTLTWLTENLAYELRQSRRLTGQVSVKIRYADFNTYTMQKKVMLTASDAPLIAVAKELFDKLYEKRMLIRLLGVKFGQLVYGTQQIDLFADVPEMVRLAQAMDTIRHKYGFQHIMRAQHMPSEGKGKSMT